MKDHATYLFKLSVTLKNAREPIMKTWEEAVRLEIEAAREQNRIALRDHLPKFLDRLSQALDPTTSLANAVDGSRLAGVHGRERAELRKYSIAQILKEYQILRFIVFSALEEDLPLPPDARDVILTSFDSAECEAADAFVEEKFETERERRARVERERDQSIKLAERLKTDSELQTKFVATLSHDLRNPIGAIKMALELLMQEIPSTPDSQSLSELMERNLQRTEVMLLDLLDVSRVRSGHKLPLDLETCNLTWFARGLISEMSTLNNRNCQLVAKKDIIGVWSADRLRRMIENLLSNALKYGSADHPVTLTLSQDATHTTIAVHNDGQPIPPEDQRTLFEPYYRARKNESGGPIGWGLGLAMVRAVIDAHGGTVEITSNAESGTTFKIVLPNDATPFQSK